MKISRPDLFVKARVLILNYEYPPLGGGAANALFYILREFQAHPEVKVDLVTSSARGKTEKVNESANVTIHKLPVKKAGVHYWTEREIFEYSRRAMSYAGRLGKRERFDLCHAFFALPCGAIAYRLRRHLPYIVSLRGSDVPGFNQRLDWLNWFLRPFFRRVIGAASAVQANSEGLRELAWRTSPGHEIELIYNGVDCRRFAPAAARPPGPYRLLSVCRLIERKGLNDLISAMPMIVAALGNKTLLTVVGEGNLKGELQYLAKLKGVADNIEWLGYVEHDRLPDVYRRADIFVLPSRFEGMSNALLEALASGLPVVVTRTGGTEELVRGNGAVVASGDAKALAEGVIRVLSDHKQMADRAARSRDVALEFSWENVARRYIATYQRVINGNI